MYRVLIIDDSLQSVIAMRDAICQASIAKSVEVIPVCSKNVEKLYGGNYCDIDIIIADIDLSVSGYTGIDFVSECLRVNPDALTIFVTGWIHAVPKVNRVPYFKIIVKPISAEAIEQVLVDALAAKESHSLKTYLEIKRRGYFQRLNIHSICWIEVLGRKITLETAEGSMSFPGTMKQISQELPDCFCRAHKSYIVNLERVVYIKDKRVFFENGASLHISRFYYAKLKERYFSLIGDKMGEDGSTLMA